MSVSVSNITDQGVLALQPYQCLVCHSRFTRHENLKRHAARHTRSRSHSRSGGGSLSCHFCQATFSRPDLRKRHMRRKHPERVISNHDNDNENVGVALSDDTESTSLPANSMSGSSPAEALGPASLLDNSITYQQVFSEVVASGSGIGTGFSSGSDPAMSMPSLPSSFYFDPSFPISFDFDLPQIQLYDDSVPTATHIEEGCSLYFTHVAYYLPFLHRPTFNLKRPPARHLLLAMLCLAYQYGEDPDCNYEAGSGAKLSVRCFESARAILTAFESDNINEPGSEDPETEKVAIVQSYLLLQIYAMLYLCCGSNNSANGLPMHSKMISLARAGGLMQPLPVEIGPAAPKDLESLWKWFAKNESHKRTLFAVHQVDALWYQLLSVPRSISHLEIKHDLPCPEDYWTAPTSTDWAHRQLLSASYSSAGAGIGTVQYAVAVRMLLSPPDPELISLPAFDAYGAINIAQFLISSAREISGWSTMTGTLSMERLEPLKSSLSALKASIHPQPEAIKATHAALTYEATWEIATIELQMWSPSHTEGIVGGNIEALLDQSTHVAAAAAGNILPYESATTEAIQPHVDWFLHYLEETLSPDLEAPWIPLYAYKAFLIAWQLLKGGNPGAMGVVGVQDGDMQGALMWAKKVFRRRRRWQLGKLILKYLCMLEHNE